MKVDILIYEDNILSAVCYLIMTGQAPTLKNTKTVIRSMVTQYGEQWTTEPSFDDIENQVLDWENAHKAALEIAPKFYNKIF